MASIREQILANRLTALRTALLYTDLLTSLPLKIVSRMNADYQEPPQLPALYIYGGDEPKRRVGLTYECTLEFMIEIVNDLGNNDAETALNDLQAQVEVVMYADQSCGGLAQSAYETSVTFGYFEGSAPRGIIVSKWEAKYIHSSKDPTLNKPSR